MGLLRARCEIFIRAKHNGRGGKRKEERETSLCDDTDLKYYK